MSDSLQPHGLQHARPPCPSPIPRIYSNSCPLSRWCHPTISSSVVPFSPCLQFFPASTFFQISQFFASGDQSIRVSASASVLPMNIQDWFPLRWSGWISLLSKRLWRVFSNTTVQKHHLHMLYFGILEYHLHMVYFGKCVMCTWKECTFWNCCANCSTYANHVKFLTMLFKSNILLLILFSCSISFWEIY